jgi:hypothetical protein
MIHLMAALNLRRLFPDGLQTLPNGRIDFGPDILAIRDELRAYPKAITRGPPKPPEEKP